MSRRLSFYHRRTRPGVIAYTGDGFQAILPDEKPRRMQVGTSQEIFERHENISSIQEVMNPRPWPQLDIGVGLKIAMERGILEVSTISSDFLGDQPFLVDTLRCMPLGY